MGVLFRFGQISKVPVLDGLVQLGLAIACQGAAPVCLGAYNAAKGFEATGSLGAAFRSGAIAFASAHAFKAIGAKFQGTGVWAEGGLGHIGAHAMTGGIIAELRGGKFGHGFFSAGFTKFAMVNAGFNYNDISTGAIIGRTTIAAVIGGTASKISGGKFANGAATAAMAQLFNAEASNLRARARSVIAEHAREAKRRAGGSFESIEELKGTMRPGDLRFGTRPLGENPGLGAKLFAFFGSNPVDNTLNTEGVHEHIVYMDQNGNLQNIGFTGSERGVTFDLNFNKRIETYKWGPIQEVDLNSIEFHSLDFQSSNYNVLTNNCQDYCSFIRKQL